MWFAVLWSSLAQAASLPLKSLSYTVEISGPVAEIDVRQTFRAEGEQAIAATYTFPLPNEGAVDAMRMVIGERVVEGEIQERAAAEQAYKDAVAAGQLAALTTEERPNIFTQHVGNIPPGAEVSVDLHVILPLVRKDGAWELVIPLVVAPRFVPDGVADAAAVSPPVLEAGTGSGVAVDLGVKVHAGMPLRRIESPSHTLDTTLDGGNAEVHVNKVLPDRDFILRWKTASDAPQVGMLVAGKHALVSFEPPETSTYEARVPRELTWVLDTSCSMSGAPLALAKKAMVAALQTMNEDDSFVLMGFSNDVSSLHRNPVRATKENIADGVDFVNALQAKGGTMMNPAMLAALQRPLDPKRHRVVCLISDGQIGNEDEVLSTISAHPEVTFTTLGIASSPNRYLLDEMSLRGGGLAAYATLAEAPDAALKRLVEAMDRPVMTDIRIDWQGWQAESSYPSRVPDLHAGEPVIIAARLVGGEGPIHVTGHLGTGTFTQVIRPEVVSGERALATTWARKRVADLHRRFVLRAIPDEKTEILQTALEYHILSDYTAFIAVERDRVANPNGPPLEVQQPLDLPHGQEVGASPRAGPSMSMDALSRIPAGRTYQYAVAVEATIVDVKQLAEQVPATAATLPEVSPSAGNTLHAELSAKTEQTAGEGTSGQNGSARGEVSGRLVKDKAWASASAEGRKVDTGPFALLEGDLSAGIVAQPSSKHRFQASFAADPTQVTEDDVRTSYGGSIGTLRWWGFFTPEIYTDTWALARTGSVAGDDRLQLEAASQLHLLDVDDPLGLSHDLRFGLRGDSLRAETSSLSTRSTLLSASAEDSADLGSVTFGAGWRTDRAEFEAVEWLNSPRLSVTWDPSGAQKTRIEASASRDWDAVRLFSATRSDLALLDLRQELVPSLVLQVSGSLRQTEEPLAPSQEAATLAVLSTAPTLDLRVARAKIGFVKNDRNRWFGDLSYTFSHPFDEDADALALPVARWVPSLLDAHRTHAVHGAAFWRLPTDPWTLSLGVEGDWASAIPGEGAWLASASRWGLKVQQVIPLRRSRLVLGADLSWARNDPSLSLLPLAVQVSNPDAPAIEEMAPWAWEASLAWNF